MQWLKTYQLMVAALIKTKGRAEADGHMIISQNIGQN